MWISVINKQMLASMSAHPEIIMTVSGAGYGIHVVSNLGARSLLTSSSDVAIRYLSQCFLLCLPVIVLKKHNIKLYLPSNSDPSCGRWLPLPFLFTVAKHSFIMGCLTVWAFSVSLQGIILYKMPWDFFLMLMLMFSVFFSCHFGLHLQIL